MKALLSYITTICEFPAPGANRVVLVSDLEKAGFAVRMFGFFLLSVLALVLALPLLVAAALRVLRNLPSSAGVWFFDKVARAPADRRS
jgi:hypothetical protein